ncbi:MAG: N-glycosylase/DNA lyase [Thermodesulfovibrionales bacterium]|nr:N-glycosylase/DNA lyase [Thermodesulfovibrionales bacterium]
MRARNPLHHAEPLKNIYRRKKQDIAARLAEFGEIWNTGSDQNIFCELAFCILTPQSKAKACWASITRLSREDLLFRGTPDQIKRDLHGVRFHNKKAEYLVNARDLFLRDGTGSVKQVIRAFSDILACRDWLVKNIKGFGYKEASHFLRNIGLGRELAILDRHILRNLLKLGVIENIPESISRARYFQIERAMQVFAKEIRIPVSHLDLLLWYKETGEIFK